MTTALFIIGALVFALTVYGAVMVGGLRMTKETFEEEDYLRDRVDDDDLEGLPTDTRF